MRLLRINIDDSELQRLGLKKYSREIRKTLNTLANTAVKAFQSKVPIETGQLRQNITASVNGRTADINLAEFTHTNPRGHSESSSRLAKILQDNQGLKRRMTSQSEAPFTAVSKGSPTAGWIDKGRSAFYASYRKYLTVGR